MDRDSKVLITNEFGVELKPSPLQEEIENKMRAMRIHETETLRDWLVSLGEEDKSLLRDCELIAHQDPEKGAITYYVVLLVKQLNLELAKLHGNLRACKALLEDNYLYSLTISYEDKAYKDNPEN